MISRKKIISKSCDELTICESDLSIESDEDVWYQKDKLYQDHVQEVLMKWDQIDDEIWGKIICMEKNRRVAKAYARIPLLNVCGSSDGFDGFNIGLAGFENPLRDAKCEEALKSIGKGVRIRIDEEGNVLAKKCEKCPATVKDWHGELLEPFSNCIAEEVIYAKGKLELEKTVKIFDMQKFQRNIAHELKDAYPDRRKLERQCITAISFAKNTCDLLETPVWIMIINIVALEVLKSKMQPNSDDVYGHIYSSIADSKDGRNECSKKSKRDFKKYEIKDQQQPQQQQMVTA
ncbi:uncharacterized protein B4U79_15969 [Dinothrombium tinctorium]|uniref:MH2 domain-containing protein n=1 Tax=Dinothrombium tinctorium TaxID=1965070 RepID=A0A3S3SI22_9ACAR|nr:uncharacterized protein B4U79_15969 [Dinothrombium tinctorium]